MKISKEATGKIRHYLDEVCRKYPIRKDGRVRKNLSRHIRDEIVSSYTEFLYELVAKEIRPVNKEIENIDVTKLYIPSDLIKELDTLLESVYPILVLYAPVDIQNYKGELSDKNVVIFDDGIIITRKRGTMKSEIKIIVDNLISLRKTEEEYLEMIFSEENKRIWINRIKAISAQLVRGEKKSTNCSYPLLIPFSITKNGFEEEVYPASFVNWDITENSEIKIYLEASYRGCLDNYFTFVFPISETDFVEYLKQLERKAEIREKKDREY